MCRHSSLENRSFFSSFSALWTNNSEKRKKDVKKKIEKCSRDANIIHDSILFFPVDRSTWAIECWFLLDAADVADAAAKMHLANEDTKWNNYWEHAMCNKANERKRGKEMKKIENETKCFTCGLVGAWRQISFVRKSSKQNRKKEQKKNDALVKSSIVARQRKRNTTVDMTTVIAHRDMCTRFGSRVSSQSIFSLTQLSCILSGFRLFGPHSIWRSTRFGSAADENEKKKT